MNKTILYPQFKQRMAKNGLQLKAAPEAVDRLFELLDRSFEAHPFDARAQRKFLAQELRNYPIEIRKELEETERELRYSFAQDESYGEFSAYYANGFVRGSDDTLFIDFGSWFLSRGTQLVGQFFEEGPQAIVRYVKQHHIPSSEYEYEAICYAFSDEEL